MFLPFCVRYTCYMPAFSHWLLPVWPQGPGGLAVGGDVGVRGGEPGGGAFIGFESTSEE